MSGFKYDGNVEMWPGSAAAYIVELVGEKKRVLEVGCATGYMSRVLSERLGCQVTGIEIDPRGAEKAAAYCQQVICGDVEQMDMPFAPASFDVVLMGDVLEHLRFPDRVLEKVSPLLTAGGYVVASIPNITHIAVILEMARGRFLYQAVGLLDDTHLRFFCRQTVGELFRRTGYQITQRRQVIIPPELTEFQSEVGLYPPQMLDFIQQHHPDYHTYQFVVKAVPNAGLKASQALAGNVEPERKEWDQELVSGKWHSRAVERLVERLRRREQEHCRELQHLRALLREKEAELASLRGMSAKM
ncbi:MAG: class I SAM-dependent methyltransferase [Desulfurispora sp.]|uniref:class I SAM-dependent methyltransferase n=1 Tax=Desulfurispora sp. TaxID=3014275 RepID=UPI004048FACB